MSFATRQRSYDDYLINRGNRVEFKDEYGDTIQGTVVGCGAAGNYLEILGDDGRTYEGYSSDPDLHKLFD